MPATTPYAIRWTCSGQVVLPLPLQGCCSLTGTGCCSWKWLYLELSAIVGLSLPEGSDPPSKRKVAGSIPAWGTKSENPRKPIEHAIQSPPDSPPQHAGHDSVGDGVPAACAATRDSNACAVIMNAEALVLVRELSSRDSPDHGTSLSASS